MFGRGARAVHGRGGHGGAEWACERARCDDEAETNHQTLKMVGMEIVESC